jgi:DNA-binding MarR family transcriptional regulator
MSVDVRELAWKLDTMFMLRRIMLNKTTNNAGLYMGQLPILAYICHNDGCTQKEISDWLNVSPASIALSTKRLQKAGFIKKTVDKDNLRCNRLSVTESGSETAFKCREAMNLFDTNMFGGIGEEGLAQFGKTLDTFINNLTGGEGLDVDFVPMMEMDETIQKRIELSKCKEHREPEQEIG